MIVLTKAQREAVFRVFTRDFPGWVTPTKRVKYPKLYKQDALPYTVNEMSTFAERHPEIIVKVPSIQYRRFRARVRGGPGCVMLPWQGMWLGIEEDGYTHS